MRLLERESHLLALRQYAEEAGSGRGRLVLVGGEAGIGKSVLLEQLEQELTGSRWCWGACDGLFTPRPLGPLLDVALALGGRLLELCRGSASREELFTALLDELTGSQALTVLVFEDVHWADEATLDLVRFLGRRVRDVPVLLVVTYRDDGLSTVGPLRVALGELAGQRSTRRLALPPLSLEAVHLVAAESGMDGHEVYRLSGGNPFFVGEIVRAEHGLLPASARDAVLSRVAGLGGEAREVLDVAALLGARVEPGLLQAVTHASAGVIDELLTSGVVQADDGQLRFRHEIARMAVESAVPPHRRTSICRAVLEVLLASRCDEHGRLAFYAEGAADAERVLVHAPRAGRAASALAAHREAAAQFERALRFASATAPRAVAELYDELASELALIDRWQDSAVAREAALVRWRGAGRPASRG